jgi:hypothetical protein
MTDMPESSSIDQSSGVSHEQSDDFSSTAPQSWSQSAPYSSAQQPITAPAPGPWPGQESQQPLQPPGVIPPAADYPFPPPGQPGPFSEPGPFSNQPGAAYPPGQFPPGSYLAGQSPVGQYGYPPPFYVPAVPRNNPFAITALVLGLVQLLGFFVVVGNIVCAVPAIIFGSIALRQIRQRGERGRGMAIAGLVLGIVGVVLFVLIIILIVIGLSVENGSGSGSVSG